MCCAALTLASSTASAVGSSTYTYLRCFYKIDAANTKPATTYVWGRDPSSNDYFRINGYWWADGIFSWENMFYSDTSQDTLRSVCLSTLASQGINKPFAMYAAADTSLSLNYTVWSIDRAGQSGVINKIISFGDSLSDMQNMYNGSQWKLPATKSYFAGRFSNGNNWLDYLSQSLKLPLYNWAVGGAAADAYFVVPGVSQQVDSWITYMRSAPGYQAQNSLFTMFIGGNDLVNYGRSVASIITTEQQAVEKLIATGAKHILLVNLPDVSRAPTFALRSDAATIQAQVLQLNQQLSQMRDYLQAKYGSAVVIRMFDAYSLFNDLLARPANYGVNNTTQSCLNINSNSTLNYTYTWSPRSNCTNADSFVFWDLLHPTTHTHQLLGNYAASFVQGNFPALTTP
ncbi:MAG: SGNH/GDSL hydrolase family protein [Burkholderiales bacterium]|nr:SGNH/GDSL hydrolase family protein [Burkholderiales bacterium]